MIRKLTVLVLALVLPTAVHAQSKDGVYQLRAQDYSTYKYIHSGNWLNSEGTHFEFRERTTSIGSGTVEIPNICKIEGEFQPFYTYQFFPQPDYPAGYGTVLEYF
jgi:hypothetical protein